MATRVMGWFSFASLLATLFTSQLAQGYYISAYAVGNHQACRASNLPGTIVEIQKFFASPYFPDDAQKNVFWQDSRVKAAEWGAAGDRFESTEAVSGFDGSDASLITYIASHGITSRASYYALSGNGSACEIRNTSMSAGDNMARYLILSTCQGLKIGNGDDPGRTGENPSVTWNSGNAGLNCIFGYSNNMVDSNKYGEYLLQNLATSDESLSASFFRASRMVHSSNIPATLCFGPDDQTARQHLTTDKRFTEESNGKGGSAWSYAQSNRVAGSFAGPTVAAVPRTLKSKIRQLNPKKLARSLLGKQIKDLGINKNLGVFRSDDGILTYNHDNGGFHWRRARMANVEHAFKLKDSSVIKIASDFLTLHGLPANDLVATDVIDIGFGTAKTQEIGQKIVAFHQAVKGLTVLDYGATIEVTVAADGSVVGLQGSLIDVSMMRIPELVDSRDVNLAGARQQALASLNRKMPGSELTVVDSRVGYDGANFDDGPSARLTAVLEVVIEARQGEFARRYVERVPL